MVLSMVEKLVSSQQSHIFSDSRLDKYQFDFCVWSIEGSGSTTTKLTGFYKQSGKIYF